MTYVRGRQSDHWLKLSHDRKVSPQGWYQPSRRRWVATIPNSFGLPAGTSCPGKTGFCTSCYAVGSEQSAGVAELVNHNLRMLQMAAALDGVDGMAAGLLEMLGRYRTEADRRGVTAADRMFRIHWDGDFYSLDYAEAWAIAMRAHPDVRFWCYTRSFRGPVDVIPVLSQVDNLTLYLSVDAENAAAARGQVARFPSVLLAGCGVDYRQARALVAQVDRPTPIVCPENTGRMELMADGRGACVTCRLCPDGRRDILFSTSHREDVGIPVAIGRKPTSGPAPGPPGSCGNPACGNPLPPRVGRGRPALYCGRPCQVAMYRARQKAGASS